jgi:uncharacterized protein (DUF305 family)
MRRRFTSWIAVCAVLLTASPVFAQSMPGMQMGKPTPNLPPSTKAYRDAMTKMDQGMSVTYSGDADKDFVAGMIPHHQGAIDMAKIELAFGSDPETRKLAEDIIKAQEAEIATMREWLKKNGE